MTLEDQVLFQLFNIKGYDFEKATETPELGTFSGEVGDDTTEGDNVYSEGFLDTV